MKISQRTGRLQRPEEQKSSVGPAHRGRGAGGTAPCRGTQSPQLHFPPHRHRQAQEGP